MRRFWVLSASTRCHKIPRSGRKFKQSNLINIWQVPHVKFYVKPDLFHGVVKPVVYGTLANMRIAQVTTYYRNGFNPINKAKIDCD